MSRSRSDSDRRRPGPAPALMLALTLLLLAGAPAGAGADPLAAFGGQPGLDRIASETIRRAMEDDRLRPYFADVNRKRVAEQLAIQFCAELGGPCTYKGKDMRRAHAKQDIRMAHFNALVEVLQDAMAAEGVPFPAQNRLLARLAPMYRDIVRP